MPGAQRAAKTRSFTVATGDFGLRTSMPGRAHNVRIDSHRLRHKAQY
jgi:hypothetical protein